MCPVAHQIEQDVLAEPGQRIDSNDRIAPSVAGKSRPREPLGLSDPLPVPVHSCLMRQFSLISGCLEPEIVSQVPILVWHCPRAPTRLWRRANSAKECQVRRPSATFAQLSANFTHATCRFVPVLARWLGLPPPSVEVGGEGSQIDLAGEKSERSAFLDQIEQTRRECKRMGVN